MSRRKNVDQILQQAAFAKPDAPSPREKNLAMISHDLRTALSGITGGLTQIDLSALDDDLREILAQVSMSGRHLAKLLEAALEDELIGGGEASLKVTPIRLSRLLEEVDDLWRHRATEKGLDFTLEVSPDCPQLLSVDTTAFHRLIGNLVGNAVKFTTSGSVCLIARGGAAGELAIVVRDTGPGFSQDALDMAFQMYGRPANSTMPGTGVGLHICKLLTEKMAGSIAVRNRSDGGAEVTVRLAVAIGGKTVGEDDGAVQEAAPALPDLSRLKILLAEDNTTNQLVITQMLRAMKAEPVLASDGVEALARFEEGEFDIALLDIEMPRISGLDVIHRVRSRLDGKSTTCLVALTAYAMKEHRERIFAAGADGLIPKPLNSIEELGQQILSFVGKKTKPQILGTTVPQAASSAKLTAGIDRRIYDALSDAMGADSMAELLRKVTEDMDAVREGIKQGKSRSDGSKIRSNTHILISVAGVIGATGLQSTAEKLNLMAKQSGHPGMDALSERCLSEISDVLEIVRAGVK